MKHLFEEKGAGCKIPEEFQNKLTFLEAIEKIKRDTTKLAVIFDFYAHAQKSSIRVAPGKVKTYFHLLNMDCIKFIKDTEDGLKIQRISWYPGETFVTEEEPSDLSLSCGDILSPEKEWIVGDKKKLLSFCVRYWRVQESAREIEKLREEMSKRTERKEFIKWG